MMSMRLLCMVLAAAMLLPASGEGEVSADHPIGGVISLLQKLMIQAKEEGETEAANFQKFQYWCKKSTKKLKRAIKKETRNIARFEDQIDGLKTEISTLTADIETLTTQIEEQETAGSKAAELRQNETDFYTVTYKNLDDTIVAVDDAVEVMEGTEVKQAFIGLKHSVKKAHLLQAQPKEWPAEGAESAALESELGSMESKS